jgi:hypothetical protein
LQQYRDTIEAQPTPAPTPYERDPSKAVERNAVVMHRLLVAHPEGLTVQAAADMTGWCRLTSERVLRHMFDTGLAIREQAATGGAPAWCYNAVGDVSALSRAEPEESHGVYDTPTCVPTPEQHLAAQEALRSLGIDPPPAPTPVPPPDDELPPLIG